MMNKHFYLFGLLATLPTYTLAAVDCKTPPTCSELGYTENAADCFGKKTLCPFDTEKAVCIDSPKVGDLKYSLYSSNHNGWLLCNGSQYKISDYQKLYNVIKLNFCHRYSSRTDTGTSSNCKADYFAVPDYRGFYLRGLNSYLATSSTVGAPSAYYGYGLSHKGDTSTVTNYYTPQYEQLPNIKGSVTYIGGGRNETPDAQKAFYISDGPYNGSGYKGDDKNNLKNVRVDFMASKSDPIYDGSHVRPAHYGAYIFIYAGE